MSLRTEVRAFADAGNSNLGPADLGWKNRYRKVVKGTKLIKEGTLERREEIKTAQAEHIWGSTMDPISSPKLCLTLEETLCRVSC